MPVAPTTPPDIDGKVFISARKGALAEGDIINVEIVEALDYDLIAILSH